MIWKRRNKFKVAAGTNTFRRLIIFYSWFI